MTYMAYHKTSSLRHFLLGNRKVVHNIKNKNVIHVLKINNLNLFLF